MKTYRLFYYAALTFFIYFVCFSLAQSYHLAFSMGLVPIVFYTILMTFATGIPALVLIRFGEPRWVTGFSLVLSVAGCLDVLCMVLSIPVYIPIEKLANVGLQVGLLLFIIACYGVRAPLIKGAFRKTGLRLGICVILIAGLTLTFQDSYLDSLSEINGRLLAILLFISYYPLVVLYRRLMKQAELTDSLEAEIQTIGEEQP